MTMSSEEFGCGEETDLATAWARAYLQMCRTPRKEIAPFAVSIHCPSGIALPNSLEHPIVRALDASLKHDDQDYNQVEAVAFTIFPERIWKLCGGERAEFYREAMPTLRTLTSWEPIKNRGGMYYWFQPG
jgi:hypothetical protein